MTLNAEKFVDSRLLDYDDLTTVFTGLEDVEIYFEWYGSDNKSITSVGVVSGSSHRDNDPTVFMIYYW